MAGIGEDVASAPKDEDAPSERRMGFFEHIEELRKRLKVVFAVLIVFFVLFMVFSVIFVPAGGVDLPVPVPAFLHDNDPIANKVFRWFVDYYKPPDVNLTSLHPWDGVIVQIKVALFLALMASSPVSAYEFSQFIGPALKPSERRLIVRVATPVFFLFLGGVAVAHFIVLPFTFNFLYGILVGLGVDLRLLFVDDFITFVTVFLFAFGVAFELPVIMYGLSVVGMVKAEFWRRHWRIAVIAIFTFGAIVTPDGSGVTMTLVALPMLVLYVAGYVAVWRHEKAGRKAKSS